MRVRFWEKQSITALLAGTMLVSGVACGTDPDEQENSIEANQDKNGANGADGNQELVDKLCDQTTPLTGEISSNTTLTPDCYQVDGIVNIGAKLTIEPGTVLRFANDSGLLISETGTLVAKGTNSKKIILTSVAGFTDTWYGVAIHSNSPENALDHVIIEHTGRTLYYINRDVSSAFTLVGRGQAAVTNTNFRENAGAGAYLFDEDSKFLSFENNTFKDNGSSPLGLHASQLGQLGQGNSYETGEESHYITVNGNNVTASMTWPNQGIPYRVQRVAEIAGGTVTIEPGTAFEFALESGLAITTEGSLKAQGDDENKILFTSAAANSNTWYGVSFSTATIDNILEHVVIEKAGQFTWYFNGDQAANLVIGEASGVTVKNSTFQNAEGTGLVIRSEQAKATISDNHFGGNTVAAIQLFANQVNDLGPGNTFDAETKVVIAGGTVNQNNTWRALDVPYFVSGEVTVANGTLTIDAGAEFRFHPEKGLRIIEEGALNAAGSSSDSILFTSTVASPGTWRGISFNTNNPNNSIDHVTIENAGQVSWYFNMDEKSNLFVFPGSTVQLTNSKLNHSSGYGIVVGKDGSVTDGSNTQLTTAEGLTVAGNTFDGNADGAVKFMP